MFAPRVRALLQTDERRTKTNGEECIVHSNCNNVWHEYIVVRVVVAKFSEPIVIDVGAQYRCFMGGSGRSHETAVEGS
jgi:hypothetical protein